MADFGRWRAALLAGALVALWCAISSPEPSSVQVAPALPSLAAQPEARPDPLVALGQTIFFDTTLSDPPGTSCASCHDPERAFSSSNGSTAGVPRGSRATRLARRNAPSLLYLKQVPKFGFRLDDDDATQPVPFGGFFWDGRSDSVASLVRQPLLNPNEMNNKDAHSILTKLEQASYFSYFQRQCAAQLSGADGALDCLGKALEAFLEAPEMAPFASRYDAFVRGRGKLTPYEMQGLRLFKDPAKGGCVGCHRFYETGRDPALSMFTDYGYDAVAVPRNDKLPAERKPDLGLCERTDMQTPSNSAQYCATFRTPSLRNVAVRGSYMHNGVFTDLREVVSFYATRATDPKHWYKSGVKFEDVPAKYRSRVNVASIPYNRREGDVPALNDREIDAIVAFLQTLTDARYEKRAAD
jgi:cytochrome c peroxidase